MTVSNETLSVLASAAYREGRDPAQFVALPAGTAPIMQDVGNASGFEAYAFTVDANTVVISFAGTRMGEGTTAHQAVPDWVANGLLATDFVADPRRKQFGERARSCSGATRAGDRSRGQRT